MSSDSILDANTIQDATGHFNYEGTAGRARHNSILVTWNDPSQGYRTEIEVVEDNADIIRRGRVSMDTVAVGCTSRGQAYRFGMWVLTTELYETETVSYKASFDHGEVMPGMIVAILDPVRSNVEFAGRVMSTTAEDIVLDRPITLAVGEDYEIAVVGVDGVIQYREILTGNGTHTTLEMASALDPIVDGAMWAVFGTDIEPKPFRVIAVRELEKHIFEIAGSFHYENKFALIEQNIKLDPVPYNRFKTGALSPPGEIVVEESLFKTNNMTRTRAVVTWGASPDPRVISYLVKYKIAGGSEFNRVTSELSLELIDAEVGDYVFEVYAQSIDKKSLPAVSDTIELLGKTAPPQDVDVFEAVRQVSGVQLSWSQVTDLDLVGYEIRQGASWDSYDEIITENFVGTSFFVNIEDADARTFYIKAIDESGNYSDGAAFIVASVIAPSTPTTFEAVPQDDYILFRWTRVEGIGVTYEIREGATWEAGRLVVQSDSDHAFVLWPSRTAEQKYLIKAVSKASLYSETPRFAFATRVLYSDRNNILEYDNANDGGAGLYPGFSHRMEPGVDDTLVLSEVSSGVYYPKGEHFFTIDLGETYRARNWLETSLVSLTGDGPTWDEWTYAWDDPQSAVPWLPLGDIDGASLRAFIAWQRDPLDEEIYAMSFDNTTDDFRAVAADEEVNVTYDEARYGDGAIIGDFTKVSYTLSIPDEFTQRINYRVSGGFPSSVVFFRLEDSVGGYWIECGYNKPLDKFYVIDSDGERIDSNADIQDDDFLTIAITQSTTTRALFWHSTWQSMYDHVEAAIPTLGTFDTLYLYKP